MSDEAHVDPPRGSQRPPRRQAARRAAGCSFDPRTRFYNALWPTSLPDKSLPYDHACEALIWHPTSELHRHEAARKKRLGDAFYQLRPDEFIANYGTRIAAQIDRVVDQGFGLSTASKLYTIEDPTAFWSACAANIARVLRVRYNIWIAAGGSGVWVDEGTLAADWGPEVASFWRFLGANPDYLGEAVDRIVAARPGGSRALLAPMTVEVEAAVFGGV